MNLLKWLNSSAYPFFAVHPSAGSGRPSSEHEHAPDDDENGFHDEDHRKERVEVGELSPVSNDMEVGAADDAGVPLLHRAGMAMEVQHRQVQALDLETRRDLEEDVLLANVRSPAVPQSDLGVALAVSSRHTSGTSAWIPRGCS